MSLPEIFSLSGKVAVITGGAGMLGVRHAEAIAEAGGIPVLVDINEVLLERQADIIAGNYGIDCPGIKTDITNKDEVVSLSRTILQKFGRVDILINNAANDAKVQEEIEYDTWSRLENFSLDKWNRDIAVGLTGAFLCSQVLGTEMANRGSGVILNISSDFGIVAPDQRIYSKEGLPPDKQPVKPVSYPVVKSALIGLTRYLATYWADKNIRVNALCPGGVRADQPDEFIEQFAFRVPMGRMAEEDEYKGSVLFLVSDASSYMTGSTLIIDGGKTSW
ncbi:SDR family oxidoreductase [Chloroflexota bacterium]